MKLLFLIVLGVVYVNGQICGQLNREKRIVGGHTSDFGDHPWQAAIMRKTRNRWLMQCGGVLISDRFVLTAAHCFVSRHIPLQIRLGEWDWSKESEKIKHETYEIQDVVLHPDFTRIDYKNDLALVKLNEKVKFKPYILPVCLPTLNDSFIGMKATVTGWGWVDSKATTKSELQETSVEVISVEVCQKWYKSQSRNVFYEANLCAGFENGGHDSCQGDSGGPLVVTKNERATLIGIVSWGVSCAKPKLPGVYVNVVNYLNWINKVQNSY